MSHRLRVVVDPTRCQLHGDCVMTAPEIFRIDENAGHSVVRIAEPPESEHARARLAARNCPAAAIRIEN